MSIRLAVPNKGRLKDRSLEILDQSGLEIEDGGERKLYAQVKNGDFTVMYLRAQDIPGFVMKGAVDLGITGRDLVLETGADVETLLDLGFGHCRLSAAAPEELGWASSRDVPDGSRIATSFPNMARKYFAGLGKKVEIVEISGAAEVTPRMGVADLIVDLVASGSTLQTNHLREIGVLAESEAVLISSRDALKEKGARIRELADAMRSVLDVQGRKYLMADVPRSALDEVRGFLPGIAGPTVMDISGREDMVAIHVVVEKSKIYESVNRLKRLGASGILIVPIDRMVP